jgi:hypothetical protein
LNGGATVRRWQGGLLFACLAGLLCPGGRGAVAQSDGPKPPSFHANHKIDIPVNADAVKKWHADKNLPEPTDLQLYVARGGGEFVPSRKVAFKNLDKTGEGKSGFWFTADKDGAYEFSVQFVYPDGTTNPAKADLRPLQRAVIDTVPPDVKIRGSGNTVEWAVSDENLEAGSVRLQAKRPAVGEWTTIDARAMRATDRYAWQLRANDALEVRVLARDKAGNEGVSSLVRLPADGAGNPRPAPPGNEWPPALPPNVPRPSVLYVNTMKFDVEYTIERMGRSGVKAAHLWVQKERGDWQAAGTEKVNLTPNGGSQKLSLPYTADAEGLYGFYVIPESHANIKAPPPRKDDPAQVLVVVDIAKPAVTITDVGVRPGGGRGPIVDISWTAGDQNLVPNGIKLEYSKDGVEWREIKYKLSNAPNTTAGRYEWEVPDTELWKFYVRIQASDLATNTGVHVWDKLVIVDLETPAAKIGTVRGTGTPQTNPDTPKVEQPKAEPKKKDPPVSPMPTSGGSGPVTPPLPPTGSDAPPPKTVGGPN